MYTIRNAKPEEFEIVGNLMVSVYSKLDGFPSQEDQPAYYTVLQNVGQLTENEAVELIVAVDDNETIAGAVVYFNDMKFYGSGGTAPQEKDACGFRLLAVSHQVRGKGIGKLLTQYCIAKGRQSDSKTMVIHTTNAMKLAWGMYERLGFKRAEDLDFNQEELAVYGFRLNLKDVF